MKNLKSLIIAFILLLASFSSGLFAEESQTTESATETQTSTGDKPSDKKKEAEAEPECD